MTPLIAAASVTLTALIHLTAPQTAGTVYKPGDEGVTPPRVVESVIPRYTDAARRARVEGMVELECVVGTNGIPGDIRVIQALDPTLDEQAIETVRKWRFQPGTKDGQAVPVLVTIELTFKLWDKPASAPPVSQPEPAPAAPASSERVYMVGEVTDAPQVLKEVKPQYTADARRAGIAGAVELEGVVGRDGRLDQIRVVKSLDPSLDAEAARAARQYRFRPGRKDGQVVPVRITIEMTFTVR
jgi:TonB family protein